MLKGRLGLRTARIPQKDRHGLLWLEKGKLWAQDGTLSFSTSGYGNLPAGKYDIPFQMLTAIILQPGTSVTHDAMRLLARNGTALLVTGKDGVRFYASMPFGPHDSKLARQHARCWADSEIRIYLARKLYAWRLGEIFPNADITVLRGMEGARMKKMYQLLAEKFNINWNGRRYDRQNPDATDLPNQAINHAVTAVEGIAMIAVTVTGAIPSLGFIHEDAHSAFCLDIVDLYRDTITLPLAFQAVNEYNKNQELTIDRTVRQLANKLFRKEKLVNSMIDKIKGLFDGSNSNV